MTSLAQIFQKADDIIEKRASVQVVEQPVEQDEIFKLAEQVRNHRSAHETPFEFTEQEKIACSMAIVETMASATELRALIKFEKEATERGLPQEQVQAFFNKVAEKSTAGRRVLDFMTGAGQSLEGYINSLPKGLNVSAKSLGKVVGTSAPLAAAGTAGAAIGAKYKEKEIKSQLGMQ